MATPVIKTNPKQHSNQIPVATALKFLTKHIVWIFEIRVEFQLFRELSAVRPVKAHKALDVTSSEM
jgi:hypothetical protein